MSVGEAPPGGWGADLDRMLAPGMFIVEEPDGTEWVCEDAGQLRIRLEACRRSRIRPTIRWRRPDGVLVRRGGVAPEAPPPAEP